MSTPDELATALDEALNLLPGDGSSHCIEDARCIVLSVACFLAALLLGVGLFVARGG